MKKKSPKQVKQTPETTPQVVVTLALDKTEIKGTGATVLEALRTLKKPIKITTKSVLTITKGDKKHSRPLTIPLAQRLFYPAAQIYNAKNLELFLK